MKTIKIKVVENGHRYNTLMNLLRQDNYDFTIEAETEQAKISSNPMLADSLPKWKTCTNCDCGEFPKRRCDCGCHD